MAPIIIPKAKEDVLNALLEAEKDFDSVARAEKLMTPNISENMDREFDMERERRKAVALKLGELLMVRRSPHHTPMDAWMICKCISSREVVLEGQEPPELPVAYELWNAEPESDPLLVLKVGQRKVEIALTRDDYERIKALQGAQ